MFYQKLYENWKCIPQVLIENILIEWNMKTFFLRKHFTWICMKYENAFSSRKRFSAILYELWKCFSQVLIQNILPIMYENWKRFPNLVWDLKTFSQVLFENVLPKSCTNCENVFPKFWWKIIYMNLVWDLETFFLSFKTKHFTSILYEIWNVFPKF